MKRIASLMLSLVMAFSLVIVSFGEANAATDYYLTLPDLMWANEPSGYGVSVGKLGSSTYYNPISVTTSDKSVVKVSSHKYDGVKSYTIYAKKTGKAVIKATFKTKSGTKKTIKTTIRVKKYPKPIKSLKVNGKTVKLSKHKYDFDKQYKGTKVKVKLTPKSGWKVAYVYGHYYDKDWNMKDLKVTKKMIKNGTEIKFPKAYEFMDIFIDLENSKGERLTYGVSYFR